MFGGEGRGGRGGESTGEEGSPLVRRVEGGQWKVVGLMVRGRDW